MEWYFDKSAFIVLYNLLNFGNKTKIERKSEHFNGIWRITEIYWNGLAIIQDNSEKNRENSNCFWENLLTIAKINRILDYAYYIENNSLFWRTCRVCHLYL